MWDLPRPGLEPVSPVLAGRFSTTVPPGKPDQSFLLWHPRCAAPGHTRASEAAAFPVCLLILLFPFLLILLSYGSIITAILRIHLAAGRSKVFSICAGHLLVSLLHYGCAVFIYIHPKSCYAPEQDKIVSLIYTNVTPMLYPMIYSLRNK